jgi:hypothetical protein
MDAPVIPLFRRRAARRRHRHRGATRSLEDLGSDRVFWSTDRAIVSLGASVPDALVEPVEDSDLDSMLMITPHEDQAVHGTTRLLPPYL